MSDPVRPPDRSAEGEPTNKLVITQIEGRWTAEFVDVSVNSDTWSKLSTPMQWQAVAVADVLMHKTGAYKGSADDALTDACAIVLAMRYAPEGDNHHNADQCPYCNLGRAEGER